MFVNKSMAVIALAAIMSVAAIVASIGEPAMAILQSHSGANANGQSCSNSDGNCTGGNGGIGGDAAANRPIG